jgi:uncharacterized protein YkwD
MRRIVVTGVVLLIAGCGGGSSNTTSTPVKTTPSGNGGTVNAVGTKGLLVPALTIQDGKTSVVGKVTPISPKENRPTDAQQHGVAGGAACASASSDPGPANLNAMSAAILCLLNAERTSRGLAAVHSNAALKRASQGMANTMVKQRFFAHVTPGGKDVLDRIRPTGYVHGRWSLGENIAWGSGALATPRAIMNGWMHSPGHKANILHGQFKDIGIGIRLGAPGPGLSGGATYVTDFGRHS